MVLLEVEYIGSAISEACCSSTSVIVPARKIVFDKDDEALMAKAKRLRSEFVVGVSGRVRRRSADTVNPKLATGEVGGPAPGDPQ